MSAYEEAWSALQADAMHGLLVRRAAEKARRKPHRWFRCGVPLATVSCWPPSLDRSQIDRSEELAVRFDDKRDRYDVEFAQALWPPAPPPVWRRLISLIPTIVLVID